MRTNASNSCARRTSVRNFALIALALLVWPKMNAAGAQTTPFQHRWAGFVFDSFTFDGGEAWTVEDGGRIRHRSAGGGAWSFQVVPDSVTGPLRRIHFVPGGTPGPTGWAVGDDGWIIKTTNGGSSWAIAPFDGAHGITQVPAVLPAQYRDPFTPDHEQLWDVIFLDTLRGWMCGLHRIWRTVDGCSHWIACEMDMQGITPHRIDGSSDQALLQQVELYALDVVQRSDGSLLGMASGEPGLVFKTTDGVVWQVVLDIRCM